MAYPPTIPPADRTNDTATRDAHASDHNMVSGALSVLPWGMIAAPAILTTSVSNIGQTYTNITGLSITATLLTGRRYRVRSYLTVSVNLASSTWARARNNSSVAGVLNPPGVPVNTVTANGACLIIVDSFIVGAGATHTITSQALCDAGTLAVGPGSYLTIEDVGT